MPKSTIRSLLASPPFLRAWQALPGTHLSVFTLHRFAVPDLGVVGHDPGQLADTLARLRREGIPILPLKTIVEALRNHLPLARRAVVFTVDDGYFDFADVGAPVFEHFDCPVTVFLVSGFLDGTAWLWWDKLRFMLTDPRSRPLLTALLDNGAPAPVPARLSAVVDEICHRCTRLPTSELLELINYLGLRTGVDMPQAPPEQFRPMSWDAVNTLARRELVTFGPHSITHPVLPNTSGEHAAQEIDGSWRRLQEVLQDPLPVFSYPNGGHGMREVDLVRRAGLHAAVATVPRYLTIDGRQPGDDLVFRLPRFPYADQTQSLLLTAAGFRRLQRMTLVARPIPAASR
jgi:peptidoglycan/xylan/chitin deacetylase (PgdA/CDA1 family)